MSCFNSNMPTVQVPVTGSVLAWAIAEAGFTDQEIAERLSVEPQTVQSWISGVELPTKTQFDKLRTLLSRPESFFFLATPPKTAATTASFRNPPRQRQYHPTPDDLKALRAAKDLQRIMQWVVERIHSSPNLIRASTRDRAENVAAELIRWLRWSVAEQMSLEDYQVARSLRARIEDQGIIALNLSLGDHGIRGFCLPDDRAPLIAINTRDDTRARLFTYIHECAHLSLENESLCQESPDTRIEQWCDEVAGAFLMPRAALRSYITEQLRVQSVKTYEQVRQAANKFNVSLRAMAVRLEQTGIGIEGLYDIVDANAASTSRRGFGRGPRQTRARIRLQRYGAGYVGRLFDAATAGELDQADLQDLLVLSRSELRELNAIRSEGTEG